MFRDETEIDHIVIHCAATPNGRKSVSPKGAIHYMDSDEIDLWHYERGFRRSQDARAEARPHIMSLGYHRVGYICGAISKGRMDIEVGAHAGSGSVTDLNKRSLSYCLIGTSKYTTAQWESLRTQVLEWESEFRIPLENIIGHRDHAGERKDCPGFSVRRWIEGGMVPLPEHVVF